MGYASYTVYRRGEQIEAGYAIEDTCNQPDCNAEIDRGLGYLCGATPGGDEHGCGGYFCDEHLFISSVDGLPQLCAACGAKVRKQRHAEFRDQLVDAVKAMDGVKDAAALADKPEVLVDLDDGDQFILSVA